jgi:hypothetical protein
MNVSAISTAAAATLTATAEHKAPDAPAVIDTKPARQFRHLLEQAAGHDLLVTRARPALRDAAKQVFTAPVTVAYAAASLGIDLSVRGLDKDDADARAWLQRLRVNLQRALNDAGLLKTDSGKGRKRASASPSVTLTLDSILRTLPTMPPEELDKLAAAVADLLTAQLTKAA